MPSAEQILENLQTISNNLQSLAIFWHLFFGLLIFMLAAGVRPSTRTAAFLLGLPVLCVGIVAWLSANPFNGTLFCLLGTAIMFLAFKLEKYPVQFASKQYLVPGVLLFIFGWVYPHFLQTASWLTYLFAAPVGIIPCPTLSIASGLILILDGLGSRALCIALSIAGIFYGVTGLVQLQVRIDGVLLVGAIITLIYAFARKLPYTDAR